MRFRRQPPRGGRRISQAEGEQWRRSRSIEVGETGAACRRRRSFRLPVYWCLFVSIRGSSSFSGRLSEKSPARHPPASCPCQGVLPCLRTIDASARRKGSNGPVPGRSKWGRQPKLCQAWCRRDARAPRKPSFHEIATPKGQKRRRILAPLVVEGGPSVFRSIGVYSCPFVVRLHFQVGFLRSRRPDIPPHPVPAKASSRARACRLSTLQAAGSVRRLAAAEHQCDSAGSHLVAPHRISLRLAARLLRLPLKGGVIGVRRPGRVLDCQLVGSYNRAPGCSQARESPGQPATWATSGRIRRSRRKTYREKPHGSDGVHRTAAKWHCKGNSRAVCRGAVQSEERLPLARSSLAWASRFSKPSSDPW